MGTSYSSIQDCEDEFCSSTVDISTKENMSAMAALDPGGVAEGFSGSGAMST